jgi:hypothetical protein
VIPRTWTRAEVEALGVRTTVEIAGSIFGLSRTQTYIAIQRGRFPVPALRIGHNHLIVPVQPILDLLGIENDGAAAGPKP